MSILKLITMDSAPIFLTLTSLRIFCCKMLNWCGMQSTNPIYEGMTFFIPKVRLRHHQYPRWFTPELRHLSKCLHTLCKKVSKNPTPYLCNKLEKQTSNLCNKIQFAKSLYESRLVGNFAGNCNSKIYDYIRSLSNSSTIPSTA